MEEATAELTASFFLADLVIGTNALPRALQ
jgi:hypothetical protein